MTNRSFGKMFILAFVFSILAAFVMPTFESRGAQLPYPKFRAMDSNNRPLSAGKLYTYKPGTDTPKSAYTETTLTTPAANPIVLDSNGEAAVYLKGRYKLVLKNSAGVTQWTMDNVFGIGAPSGTVQVYASDYGGINQVIAALPATPVEVIEDFADTLTGATIVPATMSVRIPNGASIATAGYGLLFSGPLIAEGGTITGTGNITINDAFLPVDRQIFAGSGTVAFGVSSGVGEVMPQWWGAKADNSTDCTAAMQAAHATGKMVYYPAGSYRFTNITMTAGGIRGDSMATTLLKTTSGTADVIKWQGSGEPVYTGALQSPPTFSRFSISSTTARTAGYYITVEPSSGETAFPVFSEVYFATGYNGIYIKASSKFTVDRCQFISLSNYGIKVENTNAPDSGDSSISNCLFNSGISGSGWAIYQASGNGLRVNNNKFLGYNIHYELAYTGATNGGGLYFQGNSCEWATTASIVFRQVPAITGAFGYPHIWDNEFLIADAGAKGIVTTGTTSVFLATMMIEGNEFSLADAAAEGISIDYINDFTIWNNKFIGIGGTTAGIGIAANAINGVVENNHFYNVTTPVTNLAFPSVTTDWPISYATQPTITLLAEGTGTLTVAPAWDYYYVWTRGKRTHIDGAFTFTFDVADPPAAGEGLEMTLPFTALSDVRQIGVGFFNGTYPLFCWANDTVAHGNRAVFLSHETTYWDAGNSQTISFSLEFNHE